jgi:hypothetical protein
MRMAMCVSLLAFLLCGACHERPTTTALNPLSSEDLSKLPTRDFLAKLSWVDKRCRQWGADGDIDVDQTCLVVMTTKGTLVVIPNEYNDPWLKEIVDQLNATTKDKWIQRFYSIGGGEKTAR